MNEVNKVRLSMVVADYLVYNETFIDGFNDFIKNYNYEYNALDNLITYDYPLIFHIRGYAGIERFHQYLMYLKIENTFCNCFKDDFTKDLLYFYRRD